MGEVMQKKSSSVVASQEKELQKSLSAAELEGHSSQPRVILKLFIHTIAMFTLPFMAYYNARNYVYVELGMTYQQGFMYGAVAAVVVVNLVIASYVYQAFVEDSNGQKKS